MSMAACLIITARCLNLNTHCLKSTNVNLCVSWRTSCSRLQLRRLNSKLLKHLNLLRETCSRLKLAWRLIHRECSVELILKSPLLLHSLIKNLTELKRQLNPILEQFREWGLVTLRTTITDIREMRIKSSKAGMYSWTTASTSKVSVLSPQC